MPGASGLTRTPQFVAGKVQELVSRIAPGSKPRFLNIDPEPSAEPNECFQNVRRKIAAGGGDALVGWALWEFPHVYVEAEFHCVYRPSNSKILRDITPSEDPGITRRLFLPDPKATFPSEDAGTLTDSVRIAIADDPLVDDLFAMFSRKVQFLNSLPGFGEFALVGDQAEEWENIEYEIAALCRQLALRHSPGSTPCFCGSGKRLDSCHLKQRR
jgi:hypothetical protein